MLQLKLGLRSSLTVFAFLAIAFEAPPALAQMSEWPVDDANPEGSVPSTKQRDANPLEFGYWLMDIAYKAEEAEKNGNRAAAIHYYAAMAKAVPDGSLPFIKMCNLYEAQGDKANAISSCAAALGRSGVTGDDYARYFRLVLAGSLDSKTIEDLDEVVQHLRMNAGSSALADELQCELGARLGDEVRLEECTKNLTARAPNDAKTLSFAWTLAMKRGDLATARKLAARASDTSMSADGVRRMVEATAAAEPTWVRAVRDWRSIGAMLAVAAGLFAYSLIRNRALRSVTHSSHDTAGA